jgi:hypothetical protein
MQGLKILVVVMGILIVVSMGLLGWGIYNRLAHRSVAEDETTPAATVRPSGNLGEVRIELPTGCNVVEMRPHADRLYLRTGPIGLCEQIIVLDASKGRVLGTFVLRP